jgi:hypothetical protein
MKLPTDVILLLLIHLTTAVPLTRRSVPFPALRGLTSLTNSFSDGHIYTESAPTKYFHESTFNKHYDGRFASSEVPLQERMWHLKLMLKAYTETMERIGVKTWIMHGCLLGWFWNGGLMPWDKDLDFLVEEDGIAELGNWWNMTVHHFSWEDLGLDQQEVTLTQPLSEIGREGAGEEEDMDEILRQERRATSEEEIRKSGKKYLLEINPNYINTSTTDTFNHIDARWIDVSNGLYIDITTVHEAPTHPSFSSSPNSDADDEQEVQTYTQHPPIHGPSEDSDDDPTILYVKDTHAYLSTQLFPLRRSTLEGIPIHIPFAYESLLLEEYGPDALVENWYNGYAFSKSGRGKGEWIKTPPEEMTKQEKGYFESKWAKGSRLLGGETGMRMSRTGQITHGRLGHGRDPKNGRVE